MKGYRALQGLQRVTEDFKGLQGLKGNKLSLNVTKKIFMIFHPRQKQSQF